MDIKNAGSLSDISPAMDKAREILDCVHKVIMDVVGSDTQARRYLLNFENQRRLKTMIDESYRGILERIVALYRRFSGLLSQIYRALRP